MAESGKFYAAVVGAGPAGLFAARELAAQGVHVALFNRDIKPGGLAEYGIYPNKHRMKEGLRAQFRQILALENIDYYGNVVIGKHGDFALADLLAMGFQAVLVAVGAQGTKWLGLPGEHLTGVFHAKDLVYHYNHLPPFSQQEFQIGRRVAIIGMGNVMTDIACYLIHEKKVDEVIAIARRGPGEIKFERHEMERIAANLDLTALDAEIDHWAGQMRSVGEDPEAVRSQIHSALMKADPRDSDTRLELRFLLSPLSICANSSGGVCGLEVEHNALALENGEIKARGLRTTETLDVDTIIFAIGDRVDEELGLPVLSNEYVKHPAPRFPVEGISYESYDPQAGAPLTGIFVAGWSRQASRGLVGVARKDGIAGARAVLNYLNTLAEQQQIPVSGGSVPAPGVKLCQRLDLLAKPVIDKGLLRRLEDIERGIAAGQGLEEFKFKSNQEMLEALAQKA